MMNGERLKSLRISKGISQKDVANFLGIDRTTYLKYENGSSNPNIARLAQLAIFFGTTPDYLLGEDNAPSQAAIKRAVEEDADLNELLILYKKLNDKFRNRLLGAGYAILAEQNKNDGLTLGNLRQSIK